jgi:hypothetical protein
MMVTLLPSAASANTAKPITQHRAAVRYLKDAGPVNSAANAFMAGFTKWNRDKNATMAQTESFARPYAAKVTVFYRELLGQKWSAKASRDIQALARDMANVAGDIESLSTINVFNVSAWMSTFARDENASGVSADIVRSDLGLPLAKA